MQLQTTIDIKRELKRELNIHHQDKVMLFGSCFTENIGQRLAELRFNALCNPLGILYNPISIRQTIERIAKEKPVDNSDMIETDGVWNSLDFHSQFARLNREEYIANINRIVKQSHEFATQCGFLFITLGTSWVYRDVESGNAVANCHKLPSCHFERSRLSIEDCTIELEKTIEIAHSLNPGMNVIFTVSPIRHWKDGAHGNQVSKSILLISIDNVCEKHSNCHYFPAYEIMIDELRDYRFYDVDMLHPNETAKSLIWEKFESAYFDDDTRTLNNEIEQIIHALQHRPFNPESEAHKRFVRQTEQKIKDLTQRYPFLKL